MTYLKMKCKNEMCGVEFEYPEGIKETECPVCEYEQEPPKENNYYGKYFIYGIIAGAILGTIVGIMVSTLFIL